MARYNVTKDGRPVQHKGGRPTKAEEHGLHKRLNQAFKNITSGKFKGEGEEVVLQMMFDKAQEGDMKAIQWLAERFYGKEPTPIQLEGDVQIDSTIALQEFVADAFSKE